MSWEGGSEHLLRAYCVCTFLCVVSLNLQEAIWEMFSSPFAGKEMRQ